MTDSLTVAALIDAVLIETALNQICFSNYGLAKFGFRVGGATGKLCLPVPGAFLTHPGLIGVGKHARACGTIRLVCHCFKQCG